MFAGWLAFRFISDWPRGLGASGQSVPDWALQLSYFGLVPWLIIATPVVITAGRLPQLLLKDSIVGAHILFIIIQIIGLILITSRFGISGFIAGSYILAVSVSFLYIYILGLRLGEYSREDFLDQTAKRNLNILGWSLAPTITIGLIQLLTGTGREVEGITRIYGGTSSPNVMGALLLVFIGMIAWSSRHRLNAHRIAIVFTCTALLIACFSMSGLVALIFTAVIYAIINARTSGRIKVRFSWLILGIVGAYAILAFAGTILSTRLDELNQDDNSLMWRLRTWASYFDLLSQPDFLIFGGGLGFDHLGMEQEPHNEWVRVLMETGLLGLVFFVRLWWKLITALAQITRSSDQLLRRQAIGMLAITGGLILWAAVESVIRTAPSALLLWAGAGLLIGTARRHYYITNGERGTEPLACGDVPYDTRRGHA